MGCLVYAVFGSCKDITLGSTALMALMTYQQIQGRNPDFAVLLCFLTGCVQILMSVLHLGAVRSGLPPLQLPPFTTIINNQTLGVLDMCYELGSSVVLVPVISVLGTIAIAKAFASGDSVDATQELFTLGLSNLLGSLVSSMPVTGSFSRSAVNHASGVRTTMGGLYTGIFVLLALAALTPYFYFIPKATLAAVIICAVIFMIEYEVVKPMWRSSKKDLVPAIVTFLVCLVLGVEYGILIGVGVNIVLLLYPSARPRLHIEIAKTQSGGQYLLVVPENNLYFPAVDFLRASVGRAGVKQGSSCLPVVIDCRYIMGADFTAAKGVAALIRDFHRRRQPIYFYNPRPAVLSVLKGVCLEDLVHVSSHEELDYILKDCVKTEQEDKNLMEMHIVTDVALKRLDDQPSLVEKPLLDGRPIPSVTRSPGSHYSLQNG